MSHNDKLFGFTIKSQDSKKSSIDTPVDLVDENLMPLGGAFSSGTLLDYRHKSESDLVKIYRDIALHSEVDYAIDEIVNEAFVSSDKKSPVNIELSETGLDKATAQKVRNEFHNILRLLSFKQNSYEIFRRWYIDGKIYFNANINEEKPTDGIVEIIYIDPLQIKLASEPTNIKQDFSGNVINNKESFVEYYEYFPMGFDSRNQKSKIKLTKDSVVYVPSGWYDRSRGVVLSYLDKCVKPLNNLRSLEDSKIIHTLARAPMRMAYYLDVDGMSKPKAEQYIRETMARFRNKTEYDSKTGMVMNNRSYQAMLEDYWLPRRDGKATEIVPIEGSGDLLDMPSVQHFKRNVYQSLNVPTSRLEPDQQMNWGKDAEISREELKFNKFVDRLRQSFSKLFNDLLKIQLSAKQIISSEDWENLTNDVSYDWEAELHYQEMQNLEMVQKRLEALNDIEEFADEYYSKEYIRKFILGQNEQEIKDLKAQRKKEANDPDNQESDGLDLERRGDEIPDLPDFEIPPEPKLDDEIKAENEALKVSSNLFETDEHLKTEMFEEMKEYIKNNPAK